MAEKKKADANAAAPEAPKASGMNFKVILLIVLLMILFAGAGGVGTYFLLTGGYLGDFGHSAPAAPPPPAPLVYHAIDPLTVNLPGPVRILRVSVNLATRDQEVIAALQRHLPRILNALLTHLGAQDYAAINSSEGKDRLRGEIREILIKLLGEVREPNKIEGIFFTELVMQ